MNLAKLQETKSTIRFSAKLFRPEATEKMAGSWTLLTLPKNASAKLPSRDMTMVEGTINGFPFRAALEPNGNGSHWLRVNKALQDAAGADVGDTVTWRLRGSEKNRSAGCPWICAKPWKLPRWRRPCGPRSHPWRAGTGFSGSSLPSKRKRASAGSRMLATCLPRESAGLVVSRASTGARKILTSHQTKRGFRCRAQKVVLRRDRQSRSAEDSAKRAAERQGGIGCAGLILVARRLAAAHRRWRAAP